MTTSCYRLSDKLVCGHWRLQIKNLSLETVRKTTWTLARDASQKNVNLKLMCARAVVINRVLYNVCDARKYI